MIGLKDLYVGLILNIYNLRKPLSKKLVLHQILNKNKILEIFSFFQLYLLNVSGMV